MQCPHCFREMNMPGVCPFCGYDGSGQEKKYPLALRPGSILNGRYILGHVLGQGGFGITYIAQDYRTKERVAIKEYFPAEFAGRSGVSVQAYSDNRAENFAYGKEQFLEEAKTLAAFIGNNNIVRIYSYFEENGTAYLCMEYVDGLPLDKYMAEHGGRLSPSEADRLLLPLMEALEAVHAKGIVHRDIAPDNILVDQNGTAKLIDFGAARYSTGEKSKSLDVILKHGFAPYEQYMRRGRQGPWTDVYALAATYYYAITGKVPPEAVERKEEDTLIPPGALGAKLSAAQEDVLLRALEVPSAERYQSMAEFHRAMLEASPDARETERQRELELREELARLEQKRREREAQEEAARLEQERLEREAREKAAREERIAEELRVAARVGISYGNRQLFSTGSGFLVGEAGKGAQYVVTNRHVVDAEQILADAAEENGAYRNSGVEDISVWVLADGKCYEVNYADNVILSQIADLAVLKLKTPVPGRSPAVLGGMDGLKVTDTVYALGFPGSADVEDYNNDWFEGSVEDKLTKLFPSGVDNVSVTRGNAVKTNVVSGGITHIQHDADLSYGSSGGPLVTADGIVAGINAWSHSEGAARAYYAIEVGHLKTFLKQNKIAYAEPSAAPASAPEPAPAPEPEPESRTTLYAGIGAAAAAVIVLAALLGRKKKNRKKAAAQPDVGRTVAAAPPQKPLVPILRSLAAQHGGQKVTLGRDAVLLGRSRDCKVRFKEETPGVSSRHCAVTWDPDAREFILKDMGSTYGTFLDSGMRLEPNRLYRLKPGESFYLGEKDNIIRLEVE